MKGLGAAGPEDGTSWRRTILALLAASVISLIVWGSVVILDVH
jgi:hypothetical protein